MKKIFIVMFGLIFLAGCNSMSADQVAAQNRQAALDTEYKLEKLRVEEKENALNQASADAVKAACGNNAESNACAIGVVTQFAIAMKSGNAESKVQPPPQIQMPAPWYASLWQGVIGVVHEITPFYLANVQRQTAYDTANFQYLTNTALYSAFGSQKTGSNSNTTVNMGNSDSYVTAGANATNTPTIDTPTATNTNSYNPSTTPSRVCFGAASGVAGSCL